MTNMLTHYINCPTGNQLQHNQPNGMDHMAAFNAQMRELKEAQKHVCDLGIQSAVNAALMQLDNTTCCYHTQLNEDLFASIHQYLNHDIINIAKAIGSGTQHNVYSIALMMLTAFTAATRGRVRIKCTDSWMEPTNLNLIVTAPSGTMKSAVISRLHKPFEEFASNANREYNKKKEKLLQLKKARKLYSDEDDKMLRGKLRKEHISLTELFKAIQENDARVNSELPDAKEIHKVLLLFKKFTPAGFFRNLAEQGGYAFSMTAEGDFLASMLLNSSSDPELFNSLHDSERVTKITGRNTRYDFAHAGLSSVNFIQPAVLKKLIKKYKNNDIGVLERFMILHNSHTSKQIMYPPHDIYKYSDTIDRLLKLYYTQDPEAKQYEVHLTNEALEHVLRFQPYLQNTSETESALNKLRGLIIRLAWAIHVCQYEFPHQHSIGLESVHIAIAFCNYLLPHIEYLHSNTGLQAHEDAKNVFEKIISIQIAGDVPIAQGWIDSRILQQRTGIRASEMPHALAILVALNFIRVLDVGRKSNIVVPRRNIGNCNFQ